MTFVYLLAALRPKHWVKNLVVAAPLLFSASLFEAERAAVTAFAVALFSAVASSVYLINDIADLEHDRRHPEKRRRPLAAGKLPVPLAWAAAGLLAPAALGAAAALAPGFGALLALFLLLNLLYSFVLKRVVILDVLTLAAGFVLRVLAGAVVIGVPPSEWLVMCTILLALFLGFAKRRHELVLLAQRAGGHRQVLRHYSPYLLDQLIIVVTSATVLSYALYTVAPATVAQFGTTRLVYTVPLVLYGVFRYLYLVHQRGLGGNPTGLFLTDPPLLVTVLLWLIACGAVVYGDGMARLVGL